MDGAFKNETHYLKNAPNPPLIQYPIVTNVN